jgi:hypothetical protein
MSVGANHANARGQISLTSPTELAARKPDRQRPILWKRLPEFWEGAGLASL